MRGDARTTYDLSDPATLNTPVQSGDVITVSSRPQEFYYIGGRINFPVRNSSPGITLLQALLASGGTPAPRNSVEISREGADGRLVTIRFSLKEIKSGTWRTRNSSLAIASKWPAKIDLAASTAETLLCIGLIYA